MKYVVALVAMALAGCHEPVRIALPPVELTECADRPGVPDLPAQDGTPETQRRRDLATSDYIIAWYKAHGDCKAKVAGIKAWRDSVK